MSNEDIINRVIYEKALKSAGARAIVGSILSREDASTIAQIQMDVQSQEANIRQHLERLIQRGVLMKDTDPSTTKHRHVYFIAYKDDALQDVLKDLFPVEMGDSES